MIIGWTMTRWTTTRWTMTEWIMIDRTMIEPCLPGPLAPSLAALLSPCFPLLCSLLASLPPLPARNRQYQSD